MIKDFKHMGEWYAANFEKFHHHFNKITFVHFIWSYERVFGFRWKEQECQRIYNLLLKPKTISSPKAPHLNDFNVKDLTVILQSFRNFFE